MFPSNTQKEKQKHFAHLAWSPSPASLCSLLVLLFTSFLKQPITSPSLTFNMFLCRTLDTYEQS